MKKFIKIVIEPIGTIVALGSLVGFYLGRSDLSWFSIALCIIDILIARASASVLNFKLEKTGIIKNLQLIQLLAIFAFLFSALITSNATIFPSVIIPILIQLFSLFGFIILISFISNKEMINKH